MAGWAAAQRDSGCKQGAGQIKQSQKGTTSTHTQPAHISTRLDPRRAHAAGALAEVLQHPCEASVRPRPHIKHHRWLQAASVHRGGNGAGQSRQGLAAAVGQQLLPADLQGSRPSLVSTQGSRDCSHSACRHVTCGWAATVLGNSPPAVGSTGEPHLIGPERPSSRQAVRQLLQARFMQRGKVALVSQLQPGQHICHLCAHHRACDGQEKAGQGRCPGGCLEPQTAPMHMLNQAPP